MSKALHLPLGSPCPNCATPLQGGWCHACGQKAESFHRSIWHLAAEAFEGLTHFDGRFWNTAPRLIVQPAAVTQDYLAGRRASQVPPFRLYLVTVLIFFLAWGLGKTPHVTPGTMSDFSVDIGNAQFNAWLHERLRHAVENPQSFLAAIDHWSHQFAILALPLAALLLSAIFAFRKRTYVFDHLIFSMHSLSVQGLLFAVVMALGLIAAWSGWLLLLAPVHLFVHMRGVYGTSGFGTLVRMALLFVGSCLAFAVLMAGLFLVGLAQAH